MITDHLLCTGHYFRHEECSSEHCRPLPAVKGLTSCEEMGGERSVINDLSDSGELWAWRTSYLSPGVRVGRDLNEEGETPRTDTGWNTQATQKDERFLTLGLTCEIMQLLLGEAKVASKFWPHMEAISGFGAFTNCDQILKP